MEVREAATGAAGAVKAMGSRGVQVLMAKGVAAGVQVLVGAVGATGQR